MSTRIRPWLAIDSNNEAPPGPGAYDTNFRDELKSLGIVISELKLI